MDNGVIKFIVYDLNKRDFMLNYGYIFKSISSVLFSLLHKFLVKDEVPKQFQSEIHRFFGFHNKLLKRQ